MAYLAEERLALRVEAVGQLLIYARVRTQLALPCSACTRRIHTTAAARQLDSRSLARTRTRTLTLQPEVVEAYRERGRRRWARTLLDAIVDHNRNTKDDLVDAWPCDGRVDKKGRS